MTVIREVTDCPFLAGFSLGGNRSIADVKKEQFRTSNRYIWLGVVEVELAKSRIFSYS